MKNNDVERFWKYVRVGNDDECWNWEGGTTSSGYGGFWLSGKMYQAHRISYMIRWGAVDSTPCVRHHCDNKRCVNPDHLFLCTHSLNMQDMARKGRQGNWKLTKEQVILIRLRYKEGKDTQSELAQEYKVAQSTIGRLVRGKKWRQTGGPITNCGKGGRPLKNAFV